MMTMMLLKLHVALLLAFSANKHVSAFSGHVNNLADRAFIGIGTMYKCHRSGVRLMMAGQQRDEAIDRRTMVGATAASLLAMGGLGVPAAQAGIDPSALKALPTEGDTTGATTRLKQIKYSNVNPENLDAAFEKLPSGVSFGDFREGKGDAVVQPGSKVAVEMSIRCKSFATATEPGGVKYFTTKEDTDFNELAFTIGNGDILAGLEEGMAGMKKGGIRRIEVPGTMVFAAKKEGQLPLPSEKNKEGKRRFEALFKTDASLLFEVLVTRIK
jgi:hypothetical protein